MSWWRLGRLWICSLEKELSDSSRSREREREQTREGNRQTGWCIGKKMALNKKRFALALIQPEVLRYSRQTQICACMWFISHWWLMWVLCWKSEEQNGWKKDSWIVFFVPLLDDGTTVSADSWTAALGLTECVESYLTRAVYNLRSNLSSFWILYMYSSISQTVIVINTHYKQIRFFIEYARFKNINIICLTQSVVKVGLVSMAQLAPTVIFYNYTIWKSIFLHR